MGSYIREKRIYCGKNYQEVDIYPYSDARYQAANRPVRSKKRKVTEPKQRDLNEKNSRRYFIQTTILNFGSDPEALHVSCTYGSQYLPKTLEEAERQVGCFIRRIKYRRKKLGLPPLKYMLVTSCVSGKDSGKPVRIHHHIIMNGGLSRDEVENLWRVKKLKGQKEGYRIGFCNADRLQVEGDGIAALCNYLVRQGSGKKRWSSSHNLDRSSYRTTDRKYTRRQTEKWAKDHPSREFWERKYPGWTLAGDDYGITYEYNELTGWGIYLKLRRKEPHPWAPPGSGGPGESTLRGGGTR